MYSKKVRAGKETIKKGTFRANLVKILGTCEKEGVRLGNFNIANIKEAG